MEDFLNTENLNKEWMIMNIYNHEYNIDGLFPHWVKSAMDSLISGTVLFSLKIIKYIKTNNLLAVTILNRLIIKLLYNIY